MIAIIDCETRIDTRRIVAVRPGAYDPIGYNRPSRCASRSIFITDTGGKIESDEWFDNAVAMFERWKAEEGA